MPAPETWRLFVAVFPPAQVQRRVHETARPLAESLSPKAVAWTRLEQIHLTLNFLGNVERAKVEALAPALDSACQRSGSHILQARELGCFPNAKRPQVLWAGLTGAIPALADLKRALDGDLNKIGFAPETRPFHPHLTIGRVKWLKPNDRQHIAEFLEERREKEFGSWTVTRVDLMRSILSSAGAEYTTLQSFPLHSPTAA
jgi:2'-5' RNA ligase